MTNKIKEQILAVRDTGETNMFDRHAVMYIAHRLGLYELVVYLDDKDNRDEYGNFIMYGKADITEEKEDSLEPTREEQKKESLTLLEMLFGNTQPTRDFDEFDLIHMCNGNTGGIMPLPQEKGWEVCRLTRIFNKMAYLVITTGDKDYLLFVSGSKEDWPLIREDLAAGEAYCYALDLKNMDKSKFTIIRIEKSDNGGYRLLEEIRR